MQDEHDLRVFRLCALWFANASDTKVNNIIRVRTFVHVYMYVYVRTCMYVHVHVLYDCVLSVSMV